MRQFQIPPLWIRMPRVGLLAGIFLVLVECRAQAPSNEEQQYFFSVLPLIEQGKLNQAEDQLVSGLERYPRSAILHNALGIVYSKQHKLERAASSFRRALEILPSFTAAQLQLGALDQRSGNKDEAAKLFRAAGDSTTNFEALVTAGLGLADCEDYPGAAGLLEKAHKLKPDVESVTYNLALAQYRSGALTPALGSLASIRAADGQPDVLYLRGKVLDGLGKLEGAADLLAACRAQPANDTFCTDAAVAAIRRQRYQIGRAHV